MHQKKFLVQLYKTMVRIRECEESFVEPILKGEVRTPVHMYVGEEAVAAGVCAALSKQDVAFGNHRSHGHYLAKGGDMKELVAEIYGKETGCSRGRGGSMHVTAPEVGFLGSVPIVAGTVALAMGAALSFLMKKQKRVAVSFFGDGATGEGVLHECLNFAALKKLPMLFVCENNLYSTHLPLGEIRARDNIWEAAKPLNMLSMCVDGNDALKVYEAAKQAVAFCKTGKGPVFLECRTYRMRGHVGPDDNIQGSHIDIRPKKELEAWKKKDPIARLAKHLTAKKIVSQQELDRVGEQVKKEVELAHEFAKKSPYPKPSDLLCYVS